MPNRLAPSALERFDRIAEGQIGDDVVALVASGDEGHVHAAGRLGIGGPAAARDSLFRIASTTKPIVALATLALAREGRVDIEAPVHELLPELAGPRVLRRAGRAPRRDRPGDPSGHGARPAPLRLRDGRRHVGHARTVADRRGRGPTRPRQLRATAAGFLPEADTWMAGLGSLPLIAQPGECWLYNTSAFALGVLVARAGGAGLDDVLRTRVLEPLKMVDTGFWTTDTDRLATCYRRGDAGLEVYDPPVGAWSRRPAFLDGAGGSSRRSTTCWPSPACSSAEASPCSMRPSSSR